MSMAASRTRGSRRAEALDPELWMTPEQVLDGVRNADAQYDKLRAELAAP